MALTFTLQKAMYNILEQITIIYIRITSLFQWLICSALAKKVNNPDLALKLEIAAMSAQMLFYDADKLLPKEIKYKYTVQVTMIIFLVLAISWIKLTK